MREYHPECRCDPRRPLNPVEDHENSCPVHERERRLRPTLAETLEDNYPHRWEDAS